MEAKTVHTATPFSVTSGKTADRDTMIIVQDAAGASVWQGYDSPRNRELAAFIVRACNAYQPMLDALGEIINDPQLSGSQCRDIACTALAALAKADFA